MQEILINPYTAIRLFAKTYLHIGEKLLTDKKYKRTREAWIASMYLISLKKESGQEWYFKPENRDGSPDFYCYTFIYNEQKGGSIKPEMKLEVFEWGKEDNEKDFIKSLNRIKLNKIIDPSITLVCYVKKDAVLPPAVELNKEIKKINPKVKDIWYLGSVSQDSKFWRITQIYPNTLAIDIDYDEVLRTKGEHGFISAYRGKSNKLEYEPTGKQVLLTPEFEIKLE